MKTIKEQVKEEILKKRSSYPTDDKLFDLTIDLTESKTRAECEKETFAKEFVIANEEALNIVKEARKDERQSVLREVEEITQRAWKFSKLDLEAKCGINNPEESDYKGWELYGRKQALSFVLERLQSLKDRETQKKEGQ